MVNDNAPAAKPIEERFVVALAELVAICLAAGMHPAAMIEPMKAKLAAIRHEAMPSKKDEDRVATEGFKRAQEAELRRVLLLEPSEPLPAYRD